MKPMMGGICELWEYSDPRLQRAADRIVTAMAGNTELTGDQTDVLIEKCLKSRDGQIAGQSDYLIINYRPLSGDIYCHLQLIIYK